MFCEIFRHFCDFRRFQQFRGLDLVFLIRLLRTSRGRAIQQIYLKQLGQTESKTQLVLKYYQRNFTFLLFSSLIVFLHHIEQTTLMGRMPYLIRP